MGMNISIEKIKFVLKAFEANGTIVKEKDRNCEITIHMEEQEDNSLFFRLSAVHKSGRLIPFHWDGEVEYEFL